MNIYKKNDGFTLIEVISVFMIIAVISTYVLSRPIYTEMDLIGEIEIVKSHLRYVQYLALSNDSDSWKIRFLGDRYEIVKNDDADIPPNLPNENSDTHNFPPDITITLTFEGGGNTDFISFDKWGSPGSMSYNVTLLKGGNSRFFYVIKNTGAIL